MRDAGTVERLSYPEHGALIIETLQGLGPSPPGDVAHFHSLGKKNTAAGCRQHPINGSTPMRMMLSGMHGGCDEIAVRVAVDIDWARGCGTGSNDQRSSTGQATPALMPIGLAHRTETRRVTQRPTRRLRDTEQHRCLPGAPEIVQPYRSVAKV